MSRSRAPVRPGGLFPPSPPYATDFANALDLDYNEIAGNPVTPGDTPMTQTTLTGTVRPHSPTTYSPNPRPNAPYRPQTPQPPLVGDFNLALGGPVAPTVPTANNNFGTNYSTIDTGTFMGPVRPTAYGGNGSGSCRPRRTCAEMCAYNEQMKAQCKGCRSYFRRTKKYIYPKRKKTSRRRTTYRRKRSCGCGKSKTTTSRGFYTDEDTCFELAAKLRQGNRLTKPEYSYYKRCVKSGRIAAVF
jgi:hypothetical protein